MEFAQLSNRFFFYNAGVKAGNESAGMTSISNEGNTSTTNDLHRRLKSNKNLHIKAEIHSLTTV